MVDLYVENKDSMGILDALIPPIPRGDSMFWLRVTISGKNVDSLYYGFSSLLLMLYFYEVS